MLYIAATPIGNLEDVSLRLHRILKEADLILAEDTRRTKILLDHYNINKPMISFYEHNKYKRVPYVIALLKESKNIVLISSAGTPLISDPGYVLVKECIKENLPFTSLPGPSAVINALVLSGLNPNKFYFGGFLPRKPQSIRKTLQEVSCYKATLIFFESPYRLCKSIQEIDKVFPQKNIAVVREMTKVFEEVKRGLTKDLYHVFCENKKSCKGEFVILIDNT